MKKILSLAIILSCAFTSASWADGPGGNSHGQQQVWQQDADRGGPGGNRQQGAQANNHQGNNHQGNGDNRGPDRGDKGRGGQAHDSRPQARHEQDHFAWTGTISAKVSRLRNVSAVMIIGLTTGTIADYRHHRAGSTGRILTATMC